MIIVVVIFVVVIVIVVFDPRNLNLKFGQNQVSNSWDFADIEFAVGGGGGVQSHFHVKPKFRLSLVGVKREDTLLTTNFF